ncbi:hypothetical protein BGZ65_004358, partial [Modicella reniformis]
MSSSLSIPAIPSISSINEEDKEDHHNNTHTTNTSVNTTDHPFTRRKTPSLEPSTLGRTAGADSHSESDSQFDSAMESHPNSDSESDPDLESRPQSPGPDKNAVQEAFALDSTRQLSHGVTNEASNAMCLDSHNHHGHCIHANQDLGMDLDRDLHGLSVLAAAARQMPRQELIPARTSSSIHSDSNASESDGSLTLEDIDSARHWPSMSDEPRSPRPKRKVIGQQHQQQWSGGTLTQREDGHSLKQQSEQSAPKVVVVALATTASTSTSNPLIPRKSRSKDLITKDSTPRKWICKQVSVKTLGGEMFMPIWFSEEDMLLNDPVAPIKPDTNRVNMDLMGAPSHSDHYSHSRQEHHHHSNNNNDYNNKNNNNNNNNQPHHHYRNHHHHHHRRRSEHNHLLAQELLQAHTVRQRRKSKLKDMALRESRDTQDLIDPPGPIDNKRRHHDSYSKELKQQQHHHQQHVSKEYPPEEKRLKIYKRSESHDTTPVDTNIPESNPFTSPSTGARPRPFACHIEDCGKHFVDALQLERHIERHGPKELECDLDMCGKLFSSIMLLRRHQSMVHKRRSEKWESPPGTAKPRAGRSRRKEPRIVASGDVMNPAELERQPRGPAEVDQSADDYGDGDDDEEEEEDDDDDDHEHVPSSSIEKGKHSLPIARDFKTPKAKEKQSFKPLKKLAPKSEGLAGPSSGGSNLNTTTGPTEEDRGTSSKAAAQGSSEDSLFRTSSSVPAGSRPRPFHCTYDDCKKVFIDQTQLERHLERHGPKELECGIDGCRKRFSAQ